MSWNKANPDLLAAGYTCRESPAAMQASSRPAGTATQPGAAALPPAGTSSGAGAGSAAGGGSGAGATDQQQRAASAKGMVALWSVRNLAFPRLVLETKSGVTALDFSTRNPSHLAVGLQDGTVAVYDVRASSSGGGGQTSSSGGSLGAVQPIMHSTVANGKHADPVWKVHWLDRGPDRDELLITISTDGRLVQWSTEKGLEHTLLMRLRRVPHNIGGGALPPLRKPQEQQASELRPACDGGSSLTASANKADVKQQQAGGTAGGSNAAKLPPLAAQQQSSAGAAAPHPHQRERPQQAKGEKAAAAAAAAAAPPPPQPAPSAAATAGERDAFISRSTGGMSFDFSARDPSIYVAGVLISTGLAVV